MQSMTIINKCLLHVPHTARWIKYKLQSVSLPTAALAQDLIHLGPFLPSLISIQYYIVSVDYHLSKHPLQSNMISDMPVLFQ